MENSNESLNGSMPPFTSFNGSNSLDAGPTIANASSEVLMVDNNDLSQMRMKKVPKRVLHFCDGTIEEYSTDEDEADAAKQTTVATVNPKMLPWSSWFWYHTLMVGNTSLKVCDYLGESLASFFGITTPKYQFEIDEYKRMMAEEEESKKREDLEMGGWTEGSSQVISNPSVATDFPAIPRLPDPPSAASHNNYGDSESKTNQRY